MYYWLWISVSILVIFVALWLYKGFGYFHKDGIRRLMITIVSLVIVADGAFTLIDQSSRYWHDFSAAQESAIIGKILLTWHPLAFTFGIIGWVIFTCVVIYKAHSLFSHAAFFALFLGHSLGAWDRLDDILLYRISFFQPEINAYVLYIILGFVMAMVIRYARYKE